MFPRSWLIICAAACCASAQNYPAFRWIQQIDGSASDAVVGIGTDSTGNIYIAGNTMSIDFPLKSAAQSQRKSSGLYRIDGPGAAWTALPLASALSIAVDPRNPNILYASSGMALKSTDGGQTWLTLSIPSSLVRTLAIDPSNSNTLYAGTSGQGAFKSTDAGATWTAIDTGLQPASNSQNQIFVAQFWIDPNHSNVVIANSNSGLVRTADGGATWQVIPNLGPLPNLWFDKAPGVIYAADGTNPFKSTDDGQTWKMLGAVPGVMGSVLSITSDPNQAGRLIIGVGGIEIFESTDDGLTWTQRISTTFNYPGLTPDWADGALYASSGTAGILKISSDLKTVTKVGPPSINTVDQIAAGNGHVYVAAGAVNTIFVTKLDPSGNIVYSTYFGGSGTDTASAMAVDPSGNVYVTGTSSSQDFPTTAGAYSPSLPATPAGESPSSSFVFKLKGDGSVGYSTYFSNSSSTPGAIMADSSGEAFIAGTTGGNLPVTPGAYQGTFSGMAECFLAVPAAVPAPHLCLFPTNAFLAKLDSAGATLLFSTYLGSQDGSAGSVALAPDGTVFLGGGATFPGGGNDTVYHMNATGSALLGTVMAPGVVDTVAVGPDGNVYVAGQVGQGATFPATPGAFQTAPVPAPILPTQGGGPYAFITKFDPNFKVLASTLFGGDYGDQITSLAFDSSQNVLAGGSTTGLGFPTRTPLVNAFSFATGFVSKLTPDLSTLLFSTYLGDTEYFAVGSVAASPDGDFFIAGTANQANVANAAPTQVFVNKITAGGATEAAPLPFRIDAVLNAASLLDTSLSPGETIVVQGAGFGSDAQLLINGASVPPISVSSQSITASLPQSVVPQTITSGAAVVLVQSGGALSNLVVVPIAAMGPGLFSADGSGVGQGYILNADGTRNTPANPAKPGSRITIFATGVGPLSFAGPYAVAQFTPNVFIDGFYADGVAAVFGPVQGLPGQVYQLTIIVPDPASLAAANPDLKNFTFPPLVPVVLQSNFVSSQLGLALSIAQ